MGFLEDLGNAVSGAVKAAVGAVSTAADAVEDVVTGAGQVAEDVVETAANGIADFGDAIADSLGKTPVAGPILGAVTHWFFGVTSEFLGLVGGVISGTFTILSGVLGGFIRIIGGILTWNARLVIEGYADLGTAFAGAGLLIGGKLLSYIQVLFAAQSQKRRLNKEEMALLNRVFRRSIALYNIRLVEGTTGLFGINHRSFTLGNTIYLVDQDAAHNPDVLVHESTHAWQYQHRGARYAMDAVWAQNYVLPDAYSWEDEVARGHVDWVDFNLEAQAAFLQDIFTFGELQDSDGNTLASGNGVFYDADQNVLSSVGAPATFGLVQIGKFIPTELDPTGITIHVDNTDRANRTVTFIRAQTNFRPSQFLFS